MYLFDKLYIKPYNFVFNFLGFFQCGQCGQLYCTRTGVRLGPCGLGWSREGGLGVISAESLSRIIFLSILATCKKGTKRCGFPAWSAGEGMQDNYLVPGDYQQDMRSSKRLPCASHELSLVVVSLLWCQVCQGCHTC